MTDKEKELYMKYCKYDKEPKEVIIDLLNLIQTQQEDIEDYQRILDTFDKREHRKRYLEEERAKRPKLLYPDADEIYQRYYEQKAEIEKKDKIINEAIEWIKSLHDSLIAEYGTYETEFSTNGDNIEENKIKEHIINKVEKENTDEA